MKEHCLALTCGATNMQVSFDSALFGVDDDQGVLWATQADPQWNAEDGEWQLAAAFGSNGMTYKIDNEAQTINFSILIGVDGSGRARSSSIDKVVQLDDTQSIITSPFGVGIHFNCEYPLKFTVSTETYQVEDVTTAGTTYAEGSLSGGFEMTLNNGGTTNFILGAYLPVKIEWDVTAMVGLKFYFDECVVTHGTVGVSIIKGGCYAGAVEARHVDSTNTMSEFVYKVFKAFEQEGKDQDIVCEVVLCAAGKCASPTEDSQCPSGGEDDLYSYTVNGAN